MSFTSLAQLPTPAPGTIEAWLIPAAAVGSLVLLAKKLFLRKPAGGDDLVTRAELHRELAAVHDKIDARFLALSEKIDRNQKELLAALDRQATRISQVEAAIARLDERTKPRL